MFHTNHTLKLPPKHIKQAHTQKQVLYPSLSVFLSIKCLGKRSCLDRQVKSIYSPVLISVTVLRHITATLQTSETQLRQNPINFAIIPI